MTDFRKTGIPDEQEQWEKTTITECIGTPEEHEDTFYRHGNWGIEEDKDGTFEVYVIIDGTPMKCGENKMSFRECTEYIRASMEAKQLETPSEEIVPDATSDAESEESSEKTEEMDKSCDEQTAEIDKEFVADDIPLEERIKMDEEDEWDKIRDREEETGIPEKGYAEHTADDNAYSIDELGQYHTFSRSFKDMMSQSEASKSRGLPNIPMNHTMKSQKNPSSVAPVIAVIGTDKDSVEGDKMVPDEGKNEEGETKKVKTEGELPPIKDLIRKG